MGWWKFQRSRLEKDLLLLKLKQSLYHSLILGEGGVLTFLKTYRLISIWLIDSRSGLLLTMLLFKIE